VNIVAIVQARMGSTRLPGKVLMDLGGDTVLARVVRRLQRAKLVGEVMVATTCSGADSAIEEESKRLGVRCFRGSEQDVLDRYYQAARQLPADAVVRITSDCPLIDPNLVDETVQLFLSERADYASNVSPRCYPRGLDTEVFSMAALERAWREADQGHEREHVTPYFYEHPEVFKLVFTPATTDNSHYRWTLDTAEDLALLRAIYASFGGRFDVGLREVLALMQCRPDLSALNSGVAQKPTVPRS
jgi:spore coat polysaccharide biosynthesis protein SpsF (cytidylyltransferase family)